MLSALARPALARRTSASVEWSPIDPRFYQDVGSFSRSAAGVTVLPENAIQLAVIYRAINVLAHAIASIPLVVYRRLQNDGKERANDHPQYDLLHDKPNTFQTSFRWRHLLQTQKILYGNHYSEILPGRGGVGQLKPLAPTTTRIVDQLSDGRLLYLTRDAMVRGYGPERRLVQDEILHVRGFSMDGRSGIPLPVAARNAMGLALAAEKHGAMFLRRGAQLAGVLSTEAKLSDPDRKQNEDAWRRSRGGPDNSGGTALLDGGIKYTPISSTNKDSQWLEARTFQVEELLRFIGVPGVLCGYADKTSTYASAEQFFLSFVTHTVRPETENIAAELNFSVVTGTPEYYADFILEGLLKGDIKTRYSAHQLAIASGWKSRNEVRIEESYNRGPDALDEFLEPMNMAQAGTQDDPAPNLAPASNAASSKAAAARLARFASIAQRSAERLVRKEMNAIAGTAGRIGAAKRFAGDPEGWGAWLGQFYTEHADVVAADLGVSPERASDYCDGQAATLKAGLAGAISADFQSTSITALLALLED
jgi:HK97 family phage portal protein